jgi:hypothetical protein
MPRLGYKHSEEAKQKMRTQVERTCEYCGKKFLARPSHIERGQARYCSKKCFYDYRRNRKCSILGCDKKYFGLGYCKKHYNQLPQVKERERKRRLADYRKNSAKYLARKTKHYDKTRMALLTHYSNGTLKCAQCGYDDIRALDIDHINNDASKDKKKFGKKAYSFYIYLANNFPEGYQVLCKNCNWIKHIENLKEKSGTSHEGDLQQL